MSEEIQTLPTPPIGWPVHYYRDDMNPNEPIAATVTRVDGPGRVTVLISAPCRFAETKGGAGWVGDDRRIAPNRPFRKTGCWDFIEGLKPRNAMKHHKELLEKRLQILKEQEERAEAARIKRLQAHEQVKKAGTD